MLQAFNELYVTLILFHSYLSAEIYIISISILSSAFIYSSMWHFLLLNTLC